jgi:phosphoglycolate phosphatase
MIKKYKHVIWDWNGTILDDVELSIDLVNELLAEENLHTLTLEEYRSYFTIPVRNYYEAVGFDFSKESFEVVGKRWMDEYERRKFTCRLYSDVENVISRINSMGIEQSILSAYSQHTLEQMIEYYNLTKYFTHIVGLDNIYAASKVEQGIDLMNKLGHNKGEVLFVGDTLHDYEVACEIGADCALITCGHQSEEKFNENGGKEGKFRIIPSVEKLLTL